MKIARVKVLVKFFESLEQIKYWTIGHREGFHKNFTPFTHSIFYCFIWKPVVNGDKQHNESIKLIVQKYLNRIQLLRNISSYLKKNLNFCDIF